MLTNPPDQPPKRRAYHAAYQIANREKITAKQKARRVANPEKARVRNAAQYAANKDEKKAYRVAHKEKANATSKAWHYANQEKANATSKAWYVANSEKVSARSREEKYGLSPEAFQLMVLMQKNACGICEEVFSKTPHVDHCHKTGEVRGLLCGRCNKGMGLFRDSPDVLERAKQYLTREKI